MRRYFSILLLLLVCLASYSQERLGIFGGVNFSTSSQGGTDIAAGMSIGTLYDVRLHKSWFVQPRLMASYQQNTSGSTWGDEKDKMSQWCVTAAVLPSYKWSLGKACTVQMGAGPYLQYIALGKSLSHFQSFTMDDEWSFKTDKEQFTCGLAVSIAFGYRRWFLMADIRHSFQKRNINWRGHELTANISIGVRL